MELPPLPLDVDQIGPDVLIEWVPLETAERLERALKEAGYTPALAKPIRTPSPDRNHFRTIRIANASAEQIAPLLRGK